MTLVIGEQVEGLQAIQRGLWSERPLLRVPPVIVYLGDVAMLPIGGHQLVYADGTYDVWDEDGPVRSSLTYDYALVVATEALTIGWPTREGTYESLNGGEGKG